MFPDQNIEEGARPPSPHMYGLDWLFSPMPPSGGPWFTDFEGMVEFRHPAEPAPAAAASAATPSTRARARSGGGSVRRTRTRPMVRTPVRMAALVPASQLEALQQLDTGDQGYETFTVMLKYAIDFGETDFYPTELWPIGYIELLNDPKKGVQGRMDLFVFLVNNGMAPEAAGFYVSWWNRFDVEGKFISPTSCAVMHTRDMIEDFKAGGAQAHKFMFYFYYDMDAKKVQTRF